MDAQTGIKLIKMTGNSNISVYAAEIAPDTELRPHYHQQGIETYQILSGKGIMRIGDLRDGFISWRPDIEVTRGACFSIEEYWVHQIVNHTSEKLLAIFSCPESHVGADRFFV